MITVHSFGLPSETMVLLLLQMCRQTTKSVEAEDEECLADEAPYLGNIMVTARSRAETKKVYVAQVCKKEIGHRQYDKKFACYFCGKIIWHRIHNHIDACHGDVPDIAAALAKTSNQRKYVIGKLKNIGNYRHPRVLV